MKKNIFFVLATMLMFTINGCSDYLDVNVNPNQANSQTPTPSLRLKGILAQFSTFYDAAGVRTGWATWNIGKTSANTNNDNIMRWRPDGASCTWPYQSWYVYCASNLPDMFVKCEEEGAWHYLGVAQLIHAWGFMTMVDWYGEVPYTQALGTNLTPAYDDGKTIYYGCLEMLEKAIENLKQDQVATAEPLSNGDFWNDGDTDKWIRLAYGLKARWLLNASKKKDFDPQKVLDALDQAARSNADNTVVAFRNSENSGDSDLKSVVFGNITTTSTRLTRFYIDLLTNTFTGGSGVEDPRTDLLVPNAQFMNQEGELEFRRSAGIDMNSDLRSMGGPVAFDVYSSNKQTAINFLNGVVLEPVRDLWASGTTNPDRKGDSIYIPIYSEHGSWIVNSPGDPSDDRYIAYRYNGITPRIISTGTFYTRADAPTHLMCYPEVCFMKAECYFRQGKKGEALTAYKEGIRAHMELMNEKLIEYDQSILGKQVIPEEKIGEFLQSAAVAQNTSELTMAKIMQQKYISCLFSIQNFNDMRRFNYSAGNIQDFGVVYPDYGRPHEFDAESSRRYPTDDPQNERYWFRRFQHCSIEVDCNYENLKASHPEALEVTINSCPVWWDTAED